MPNLTPTELAMALAETRGLKIKSISHLSNNLIGMNLITPKGDVVRFTARVDEVFEASEGNRSIALKGNKIAGNRPTRAKNSPWQNYDDFAKLVGMGMSYREMAIYWQISEGAVGNWAAKHGFAPRRKNHNYRKIAKQIHSLTAENPALTQQELADRIGVAKATINRVINSKVA